MCKYVLYRSIVVIYVLLFVSSIYGRILYVKVPQHPEYDKIKDAIQDAQDGDTVWAYASPDTTYY